MSSASPANIIELGDVLAKLRKMSGIIINGEAINLNFSGTYGDIRKQYTRLTKVFHPDVSGLTGKDAENAEVIIRLLNDAYDNIKKKQKELDAKSTDVCTYVDEALEDYDRRHPKKSQSKTSNAGPKTNTSNGQRSSSQGARRNSGPKPESVRFTNGTFTKILNKNGDHKMVYLGNKLVYAYTFTSPYGIESTVFSNNDFNTLSNPAYKTIIERDMLSNRNLNKTFSHDVQDEGSQYGYIGYIYPGINDIPDAFMIDHQVIDDLRDQTLERIPHLQFSNGTLEREFNKNNVHQTYRIGNKRVYAYKYTDLMGRSMRVLSDSDYYTLSRPENKQIINRELLSNKNLRKAASQDVQDQNAQFGYLGKIVDDFYDGPSFKLTPEILYELREKKLEKTEELFFNNGFLRRILEEDGITHSSIKVGNKTLYGYTLVDSQGREFNITSEMDFKTFSKPSFKSIINAEVLSSTNLRRAMSTDIQKAYSQFSYVGTVEEGFLTGQGKFKLNQDVVKEIRDAYFQRTNVLKFDRGTLERELDENGEHITGRIGGKTLYFYKHKDLDGHEYSIKSENDFYTLSLPKYRDIISKEMLGSQNIRRASSYDGKKEYSQFGYVGSVESGVLMTSKVSHRLDTLVLDELRDLQLSRPSLYDALDENKKQKTIALSGGKTLYGYKIVSQRRADPGKEVYFENSPRSMEETLRRIKINGKTKDDIASILLAIQKEDIPYGYVGRLTEDGYLISDKSIEFELRRRIDQIKAKRRFVSYSEKEDDILQQLIKGPDDILY